MEFPILKNFDKKFVISEILIEDEIKKEIDRYRRREIVEIIKSNKYYHDSDSYN